MGKATLVYTWCTQCWFAYLNAVRTMKGETMKGVTMEVSKPAKDLRRKLDLLPEEVQKAWRVCAFELGRQRAAKLKMTKFWRSLKLLLDHTNSQSEKIENATKVITSCGLIISHTWATCPVMSILMEEKGKE